MLTILNANIVYTIFTEYEVTTEQRYSFPLTFILMSVSIEVLRKCWVPFRPGDVPNLTFFILKVHHRMQLIRRITL